VDKSRLVKKLGKLSVLASDQVIGVLGEMFQK
jgi:hypothetical protein